jgi:hypothetical protein
MVMIDHAILVDVHVVNDVNAQSGRRALSTSICLYTPPARLHRGGVFRHDHPHARDHRKTPASSGNGLYLHRAPSDGLACAMIDPSERIGAAVFMQFGPDQIAVSCPREYAPALRRVSGSRWKGSAGFWTVPKEQKAALVESLREIAAAAPAPAGSIPRRRRTGLRL